MRRETKFRSLRSCLDFSDTCQCYRGITIHLDHRTADGIGIVGGEHSTDDIFVAVFIEDTAGRTPVHILGSIHNFLKGNAVVAHLLRRKQNLVLFYIAAENRYLGYTAQ